MDAVAFDLDGTLLDTVDDLAAAVNMLLAGQGHAPLPVDAVRLLVGKGISELVAKKRPESMTKGVPPWTTPPGTADDPAAESPTNTSGMARA